MDGEKVNTEEKSGLPPKQSMLTVPVAIIIAGLAIAGAIYFSNWKKDGGTVTPTDTIITLDQVTKDDHIIGNLDAKVTLVVYTDLECPWCKVFHETINKIMTNYEKDTRVALVYRNFPITDRHPKAPHEAEAAECAAKLGGETKFWDFINNVFKITPSNNGLDEAELPKIAKDIGLDVDSFNKCLASGEMKARVDRDIISGEKTGGFGTPNTFVVVDKKVVGVIKGAQSYEYVKAVIDNLLAK
ncbi:MAG: DsbA family protein [Candidatus Pacebacteria bacterium]|nr:DsbA family protein [Candidatus Paceibacterota bacterium]